jgi:ribosome-associated protein
MDIRKLQRAIVDGLEDVKAQNITVFNTEHLSPLFERVVIASGTSNRQTRALASSVRETVKARGLPVLSVEGEDNGEWIIVDCGAAVVHVMQPVIREYYRLEEIWGGKPVRMKVATSGGLPAASFATSDDDEAQVPAKAADRAAAKSVDRAPRASGARVAGKATTAKAPAKPPKRVTARPGPKTAAKTAARSSDRARPGAAAGNPPRAAAARRRGVDQTVVAPAPRRAAAASRPRPAKPSSGGTRKTTAAPRRKA